MFFLQTGSDQLRRYWGEFNSLSSLRLLIQLYTVFERWSFVSSHEELSNRFIFWWTSCSTSRWFDIEKNVLYHLSAITRSEVTIFFDSMDQLWNTWNFLTLSRYFEQKSKYCHSTMPKNSRNRWSISKCLRSVFHKRSWRRTNLSCIAGGGETTIISPRWRNRPVFELQWLGLWVG